jgi:hypothetical protein
MFKGAVVQQRRTGATAWRVWQDAAGPDRIIEQSVVTSQDDHLRQRDRSGIQDDRIADYLWLPLRAGGAR